MNKPKLIMRAILTSFIIIVIASSLFSQINTRTISGKVIDGTGEALIGVSVYIKATNTGTSTDVDGLFTINAKINDVIVFSYTGSQTQEVVITETSDLSIITLKEDAQLLNTVDVVGIRKSIQAEVKIKREATTIVESITPQDIGNFSDENVIDALERVPNVQVERDLTGNTGSRASIRGLGAQFVLTSINGRTPLSTGNSGISNFREFNQGIIPTEMINGARIFKTAEAKAVEGAIGGSIDYNLLKPLKAKYLRGKNIFGSISARLTTQPNVDEANPTHRISTIFGIRNKPKTIGAYFSVLSSRDIAFQENIGAINAGIREFDLNVDNNLNGIFDPEFGDQTIEGVTAIERYNLQTRSNVQNRLALAGAFQWELNDNLEIIVDGNYFRRSRDESTQRVQLNNAGLSDTQLWQPGSFDLSPTNFLTYADRSLTSSNQAPVFYQLRQNNLDNTSTDILGGANIIYKINGWKVNADVSYSTSDFINFNRNGANVNYNTNSSTIFDSRDTDAFFFRIDDDGSLNPANYEFNDPDDFGRLSIRAADNRNVSGRIDINKKLTKRLSIDFGYRYSDSKIRSREINRDVDQFLIDENDPTNTTLIDAFRSDFNEILANSTLNLPLFEDYKIGDNQFPALNVEDIFELYGQAYEGNIESFRGDNLFDVPTERENGFGVNPNLSLDFNETTSASYVQINLIKRKKSKISGNVGLRVVSTDISSRSFSNLQFIDPLNQITTIATNSFQESSNQRTRWDVLPSMNLIYKPKNNIQIRLAGSRTISRPSVRELVPRNKLVVIDPNSAIADSNSPFYNPEDPSTTLQIGNPDLKPYFSWNSDLAIEYYTKFGGAIIFAAYHKFFDGFIVNRSLPNAEFPEEDVIGFSIPEASQQFPVSIRQFQNFTDAQLYGFEVGFNQSLFFLPIKGFGIRGNYNHTRGSFEEEVGVTENGFPGSSKNSFNGILYYDNNGIGVRVAYAWRDDFYRIVPDPFAANLGLQTARFQEGAGSLSVRASYNFSKNFQISLSGSNITGANRRRFFGASNENITDFFQIEPTWLAGVRFRF